MIDKDIIQALKENLATLKGLKGDLRRAMESIEKKEFIFLLSDGTWDKANPKQGFEYEIYRLRPDYEEKPEVVEIPVDPPSHSLHCLSFEKDDNIRPLYAATEYPDFIGFKFQDDRICGFCRLYRGKAGGASFHAVPFENLDRFEVLTPISVLFRQK